MIKDILGVSNDIVSANLLSKNCFQWKVGNGEVALFWEDSWHQNGPLMVLLPRLYRISKLKFCSINLLIKLWVEKGLGDNSLWLRPVTGRESESLDLLVSILQGTELSNTRDVLEWIPGKGVFSAKSFGQLSSQNSQASNSCQKIWEVIWNIKVPPKISIFLWKVQWGILPTCDFLHRKLSDFSPLCKWCNNESENINHLFWDCSLAKWVWDFIGKWWSLENKLSSMASFSLSSLFKLQMSGNSWNIWALVVAAAVWTIWVARNEFVFQQVRISKSCLEQVLHIRISKWGKASGIMRFGNDYLWRVNPYGAIAIHQHSVNSKFWQFKGISFDLVWAWGINAQGYGIGGIGGWIADCKGSILHKFSGPITVNTRIEAEFGAIIHMAEMLSQKKWNKLKVVICSDSMEAIDLINILSYLCSSLLKGRESLKELFSSNVVLNYVPRNYNMDADSLAKAGLSRPNLEFYWADGRPSSEYV